MNSEVDQFRSQADRIATRRERIEAARVLKSKAAGGEKAVEKSSEQVFVSAQRESFLQIQKSLKGIEEVKVVNEQQITNVELEVFKRELNRRGEEREKNESLEEVMNGAQSKAQELLDALDAKWENISQIKNPYDLAKALIAQKSACKDVVDIKSKLINDYMGELKLKDDEYIKEFKRQSDETDLLMSKMELQYKSFQAVLDTELEKIESTFVHEREELLQSGKKETEALIEKRRLNERLYTDGKWNTMSSHQDDLETLRTVDAEDYNKLKIKLETDIQILEQQLAQMRGTYQLNMEKLEYNYQVLKKREEENSIILAAQKRKDNLKILKHKSSKQEKSHDVEEHNLVQELSRMKELYEELHLKYRNFQLQDEMKFQDLKRMQEDTVRETVRKLLLADKIIHEEHLKEQWEAPDSSALRKLSGIQIDTIRDTKNKSEPVIQSMQNSELVAYAMEMRDQGGIMKKVFDMICTEASFLIDEKLQDLLLHLPPNEQSLMKIDSIFRAINIRSVVEIQSLASSFIVRDSLGIDTLIDVDDVLQVLTSFMESRQNKPSVETRIIGGNVIEKEITNEEQTGDDFWEAIEAIIDKPRMDKWQKAYGDMQEYYTILQDKGKTIKEIKRIENQNEELELLLSKYMGSQNNELQIPPAI